MIFLCSKIIFDDTKSVQMCFGKFKERFLPKKHQKSKIWATLTKLSFRVQDLRNCSKNWILKDFFEIEKMSKRWSYRVSYHFLRPSMVLKVGWAIHILDTSGSSLTFAHKQNIAKNCLKLNFEGFLQNWKKYQNAHPTGFQITFYGHLWFWKSPLVSQDKFRSNGKFGPSIFWTQQGQVWRSHINKI